jgi:phosphohistidine swiveling domain-containing protein
LIQREYETPSGVPFPVEWPDEEMEQHGWRWDQLHLPTPLTPLSQDTIQPKSAGMLAGAAQTGRAFRRERIVANGYVFTRGIPPDPGERDFFAQVLERDIAVHRPRLLEEWEQDQCPEVEGLFQAFRRWASPEETLPQLMARFSELNAMSRRLGELHALSFGRANSADQPLLTFCEELYGEQARTVTDELIAGVPNKSLESAVEMWELSREAQARAAVATLLREADSDAFLERLDSVEGGPEFRALLDRYLEIYGHRNESFSELAYETWREDPRFVLFLLRNYLDTPEDESPTALHERVIEIRERRLAEVRERLGDEQRIEEFLELVRIGQQRTTLLEDHNYHIDQRAFSAQRAPLLAIGERLVAQQAIDEVADVFYVFVAELHAAAADPSVRFQEQVAERRAERERWLYTLPPNIIGSGAVELDEAMRAFMVPDEAEPAGPGEVRGLAASPGLARGVARVIRGLDEIERLQRGDVLVTYATAPPWTPLFAVASAIVTDAGGPLSHAAVVSREYGIPAVVGTKGATARIEDGAIVTVDGSTGIVRIES